MLFLGLFVHSPPLALASSLSLSLSLSVSWLGCTLSLSRSVGGVHCDLCVLRCDGVANRTRPAHSGRSDVRDPTKEFLSHISALCTCAAPLEAHGGRLRGEAEPLVVFTPSGKLPSSRGQVRRLFLAGQLGDQGTAHCKRLPGINSEVTRRGATGPSMASRRTRSKHSAKICRGSHCKVATATGRWACPSASRRRAKQAVVA